MRTEKWCGWCLSAAPKFTIIYGAANYFQNCKNWYQKFEDFVFFELSIWTFPSFLYIFDIFCKSGAFGCGKFAAFQWCARLGAANLSHLEKWWCAHRNQIFSRTTHLAKAGLSTLDRSQPDNHYPFFSMLYLLVYSVDAIYILNKKWVYGLTWPEMAKLNHNPNFWPEVRPEMVTFLK